MPVMPLSTELVAARVRLVPPAAACPPVLARCMSVKADQVGWQTNLLPAVIPGLPAPAPHDAAKVVPILQSGLLSAAACCRLQ